MSNVSQPEKAVMTGLYLSGSQYTYSTVFTSENIRLTATV